MAQRDKAICISVTDYSETSQVAHFLTRLSGVVRLIAKGSKRPKSKTGGALDLLVEGDLVFTTGRESDKGRTLGTLMEFSQSEFRPALRSDARRLNASLYALELAGMMLAECDPHPQVFDLLHNTLSRLGGADAPVDAVLAYYQWRILRRVGLLGDMKSCAGCGAKVAGAREAYFSSRTGGLLCQDCRQRVEEKRRLDGAAMAGIAALSAAEAGTRVKLPPKQARAVNRLLAYHITEQMGKPPKTARFAIGKLSQSG